MMKRTLLVGYGNTDREDDGVAWHILSRTCARLGLPGPSNPDDDFPISEASLDFLFILQLTPELAESLVAYERICFVDAHTGQVPEEVNFTNLEPRYQRSPFTHHMTAESLLAICAQLYNWRPQAVLLSVRGYSFGFTQQLSANTSQLADIAVERLLEWLKKSG